MAKEIKVFYSS